MGEAKRKRQQQQSAWPRSDGFRGIIDLHALPPVAAINGARIRALTGDVAIPDDAQIILRAFRAVVGERSFHVGFCLGDGESFSAIGIAVIDRLMMEAPGAALHVVPVVHGEIAWDIVLRHLRSFTGQVLLFAFPDSDIYDAGTAEVSYSQDIRQFDADGTPLGRLTAAQRRKIRERKAAILDRPPPPPFYATTGIAQEESPWIFRLATPAGKVIRTAVWNGRRDYAHEFPAEITRWVGGDRIAIVQVDSPVGINRRSSLDLTHHLAKDFDGVIHWARDTETFQSILTSFIRLDLDSISPPDLPEGWEPEITILAANGR
ncbi:hypothetical protein [Brevundimonas sp. SL130]|uniref:hypothetical protein n=1 Tax=Brevundimonas sp. SL130 TaxID=2995143 RepID=UPI00226D1243|nr:hypothetical protein [Brevundimonas sp. SL130]WAC61276.1 hypothetical protein OU998_07505 [Brevundimonas sp. SL130]